MRHSYLLYCLLAIVLAVFSACSDEDNTPGGNKTGTEGFFALDAASLKDWDYGVSDGRCCLVVKTDSVGGVLACAIDKDSGRKYDFFVELDGDGRLTGLGTTDEYYATTESDDDYTLFKWNGNGELEGTTIPKTAASQKQTSQEGISSRIGAGGQPGFADAAGEVFGIYEALKNAGMLNQAWQEGRWSDFFEQLGDIIAGDIIGKLKNGGLPGIVITMRVNQVKQDINLRNKHWLYGYTDMKITDISKQSDGSYLVSTVVYGINSIPRTVPVNYIDAATLRPYYAKESENHVYVGVLCRQDYPAFFGYFDYMAQEEDMYNVSDDITYLAFRLPALGNGTYYVKPYLRSSINDELDNPPSQVMAAKPYTRVLPGEWETTGTRYIIYGYDEIINNIGGKITNFTQADARFIHEDPYESGHVSFVGYVAAEVDDNDGLEEWGVYYMKDGVYQRFPADMPTAKVSDEIRVEFTVSRDEFDYVDYQNFSASKNMRFGVYKKSKNPTGNLDYLTYSYGDMSEITAVYDKKPTVEVYDAYVTGSSPYDGDKVGYDMWCDFSFKAKVDGCLFMSCLSEKHGSEWATPNVEYPMSPDESDCMTDRTEYTFSSRYGYSLEGTNPAIMYIGIWVWPYDGQYDSLSTPYAIYCDDGSVSLITGANAVYSKGATARPSLASPVPANPERTVGLPRAKR